MHAPAIDAHRAARRHRQFVQAGCEGGELANLARLVVLPREVGRVGYGWVASEGGVAAVMVVGVEEPVKRSGSLTV